MFFKIVQLSRPLNVLIAGLSIFIAATLSVKFSFQINVLYAILSTIFITASANIINDIYDIEIDKINKPKRILASESLSVSSAWLFYHIFNICGLLFAVLISQFMTAIAFVAIILLYLYSHYFKRTIILGNILVSFLSGLAFICGALAVDDWKAGIFPAIFAFLFHFGREVIKDLEDLDGDLAHNAITFAGHFGKIKSIILININFLILIAVLIIPYVFNYYNIYYIYIVISGVMTVILFVSISLWFTQSTSWLGRLSLILKIDMFVGLVAIYLGVNTTI
jgi:geranylgeranylglycerol-phosphate geranylgeranyltransferase